MQQVLLRFSAGWGEEEREEWAKVPFEILAAGHLHPAALPKYLQAVYFYVWDFLF